MAELTFWSVCEGGTINVSELTGGAFPALHALGISIVYVTQRRLTLVSIYRVLIYFTKYLEGPLLASPCCDIFYLGSNGVPPSVSSVNLSGRMEFKLGYMQRQCGGVAVTDFATQASVPCRKSTPRDLHSFACSTGLICFRNVANQRSVVCSSASGMGPMSRRCTVGLLASPLLLGNPQMTQGIDSYENLDLLVDGASGEGELQSLSPKPGLE